MSSNRAAEVAEVLWELKRADKVATLTAIADRAGFSAGAEGRAVRKCLLIIRREWPHLEWWRAVGDDGTIERDDEQIALLQKLGVEVVEDSKTGPCSVLIDEKLLMVWGSGEAAGDSLLAAAVDA